MNGVICELCLQRPATCHLTEASGAGARELHVCASCLSRLNIDPHASAPSIEVIHQMWNQLQQAEANPHIPLVGPGITINLKPGMKAQIKVSQKPKNDPTCGTCGLTLSRFRKSNRFGCTACLDAFAEHLEKQLHDIHGSKRHVGRVPSQAADNNELRQSRRSHLQQQLDEAVACEHFEKAAQIRDQLQSLDS